MFLELVAALAVLGPTLFLIGRWYDRRNGMHRDARHRDLSVMVSINYVGPIGPVHPADSERYQSELRRYQSELRRYRGRDRARALLRTSPAFAPVTPVDRSRDGFWRQAWIAFCRTSPAFSPVAALSPPTPPTPPTPPKSWDFELPDL